MVSSRLLSGIRYSLLVMVLSSVMLGPSHARKIDDVDFPNIITIDGSDVELQLNGMGYRVKFIFDVYILGFYTESQVETRDAAQSLKGPKRIIMHMVREEVGRDKMISALNDGFEKNTSDQQFAKLESRIRKFATFFPDLFKDDVIALDYIPGPGTRVTVNGAIKGVIEGADFYTALLDIWLGDEPADDDLKAAMLGIDD